MSMSSLLVLDFDGTMTDAELEGAPFRDGYLGDLAALTGRDIETIHALAEGFEAEISENAQSYGWIFNEQIVAPASVDPYLRIMPVARLIFDHYDAFMNPMDRTRLLDAILYKYNYQKTKLAFREGAGELLRGLEGTWTYIITNSHTDPVREKVRQLGGPDGDLDWLVERVYGRARKYVIDDSFDAVPVSTTLPGLGRPVLLRRRLYHDAIAKLLDSAELGWSDLLVVGDIFELDLALPLYMGARVGLVVNPFTPDYERAFIEGHPRGTLVHAVSEIRGLFLG